MKTDYKKTILDDIVGYIQVSKEAGTDVAVVLANVAHDCNGLLHEISHFLPRLTGYGKKIK